MGKTKSKYGEKSWGKYRGPKNKIQFYKKKVNGEEGGNP